MYRAVAWLALRRGIDPRDEAAVTALAANAAFTFPTLGRADRVNPPIVIDGLDATDGIREPSVDASVSVVASYAGVRAALVREQQAIARERGVVMVGRDIGTVVLPRASLKIYRAMVRRDQLDAERAHSPLRPADDAVLLDSTGLSIQEVVERAIALARAAEARR